MTAPRLFLFDVDGTLVDSQNAIVAAMSGAYRRIGVSPPSRRATLSIVGLSLNEAVARLSPELGAADQAAVVEGYRQTYVDMRNAGEETAPLYDGVRELLLTLNQTPENLLGVATGKARRGLDHVIAVQDLGGLFVTLQTADFHPSKPHPAMIAAAMAEAGTDAGTTVMIGDTTFDMDMAAAAGCMAIGVTWGYHPADALRGAGAAHVVDTVAELHATLSNWSS